MINVLFLCLLPWILAAATVTGLSTNAVNWFGDGGVGYEVFSAAEYVEEVDVEITHNASVATDYFVTFGQGGAGSYSRQAYAGGDTLNYQLYDSFSKANILKELPGASSTSDVIGGSISTSDSSPIALHYYVHIPAEQIVTAGTYTDTFTLRVYEGDLASYTEIANVSVNLSITVPSMVEMAMVDEGTGFNSSSAGRSIDFGDLSQGDSESFDVVIRSNAGYRITMTSSNSGQLKHSSTAAYVPYILRVDSSTKDLSGGGSVEVATSTATTSSFGVSHTVEFEIGAVGWTEEGPYSDVVSVTAQSLQ